MKQETTKRMVTALARGRALLMAVLLVLAAGACNEDGTGPGSPDGAKTVSLSIGLGGGTAAPAAALFAAGLELTDGVSTLVIESAELVLREIEFKREGVEDCEGALGDDCDEFETGPYLVALPLDGSVSRELSAEVDTGTYTEIEFDVHKPEDGNTADQAFIDANPNFADISIRVTGTYNGQDFLYTTDLNEEQEVELTSSLQVTEGSGPVNVTLIIDLATWFESPAGMLVDPRTANKGEPNEDLVTDNIRASIEGFRDDDSDGISHDDDDDELDDSGGDA
jgi:hypothetical protein